MSSRLSFLVIVLALVLVSSTFQTYAYTSETADSAKLAIERAQRNLVDAYERILDAERAGADVTSLTERLSSAGADLTRAYSLYASEKYDAVKALADNCYAVGEEVEAEASVFEGTAYITVLFVFWIQVFGWSGSIVLIILSSMFVWQAFKKKYYCKVLEMKPEAATDES